MGLDMYMYRRSYVQNWEHQTPEQRHTISVKLGDNVREDIKPDRIAYITEQVAYWRKFNALHNWIVDNCAEGIDECQEICISQNDMENLLNTLKDAKNVLNASFVGAKTVNCAVPSKVATKSVRVKAVSKIEKSSPAIAMSAIVCG